MTEKEQDWKKEVQDIVRQSIREELKSVFPPSSGPVKPVEPPKQESQEPKPHWTAEELIKDAETCPNCKKEIEKIQRKASPLICTNCGEGVYEREEACPSCHGKKARNRT